MSHAPDHIQRIARLIPVADVLSAIDAHVTTVRAGRMLADAGMTAAADLRAPTAQPPQAIALRDGWAVAAEAVGDAGSYSPVPLSPPPEWVDQGTPMPGAADAVLPPDAVAESGGLLQAVASVAPGENVLPAGADAVPEVALREAGARLRAIDIAAARMVGLAEIAVRVPRVRLVATDAAFHHGREEIAWLIGRLVGGECVVARLDDLESALTRPGADAVLAIGGTGQGRNDRSVQVLARHGKVHAHGMALSPGETTAFGTVANCPVLLLPGRLDAALAAFLVVGRHLVARLTGRTPGAAGAPARLARKIASRVGVTEFIVVRRIEEGLEPLAGAPIPLQALTRADGYVLVPPEREGYQAGATVEMHPLP